jgi:hypothetical protein
MLVVVTCVRICPSKSKQQLGRRVQGNGEEGILKVQDRQMGGGVWNGRQKGVGVGIGWDYDSIDFPKVLDQAVLTI